MGVRPFTFIHRGGECLMICGASMSLESISTLNLNPEP